MALIDKTPESWLIQQQQQMQERIEKQQEELAAAKEERKGLIEQVKGFFDTAPKEEVAKFIKGLKHLAQLKGAKFINEDLFKN